MNTPKFQFTFLSPKHWSLWLMVVVSRLVVLLPFSWQMAVGRLLGRLMMKVIPRRVHIVRCNIETCFPEKTIAQQTTLVKQTFESMGMFFIEANIAYYMSDKRFNRLITESWQQLDNLAQAVAKGQGVIILSGHMMVLEIIGRMVSRHQKFAVVYKANKNLCQDYIIQKGRGRFIEKCIDKRDVKGMIRWLKAGHVLWYAPDQDMGKDRSEFVDFMGAPAATLKAIADLARLSKAKVVPGFFARLNTKGYYTGLYHPMLDDFPSGNYQQDLQRYNNLLADYVRQYPEQYNWLHRRFKTRPEGEASIY